MSCKKYRIPAGTKLYEDVDTTKVYITTNKENILEGCITGYGTFWSGGHSPLVEFNVGDITFYAYAYEVPSESKAKPWYQIGDKPLFEGVGLGLDAPAWIRNLLKWRLVILAVVLWALFRKKK